MILNMKRGIVRNATTNKVVHEEEIEIAFTSAEYRDVMQYLSLMLTAMYPGCNFELIIQSDEGV